MRERKKEREKRWTEGKVKIAAICINTSHSFSIEFSSNIQFIYPTRVGHSFRSSKILNFLFVLALLHENHEHDKKLVSFQTRIVTAHSSSKFQYFFLCKSIASDKLIREVDLFYFLHGQISTYKQKHEHNLLAFEEKLEITSHFFKPIPVFAIFLTFFFKCNKFRKY